MSDVITQVKEWTTAPFIGTVSLSQLFLTTGLTLVFVMVWTLILYHIRIAAEAI